MTPTIDDEVFSDGGGGGRDPFDDVLIADRTQLQLDALRAAARLQESIEEAKLSPIGLYELCFSANDGGPISLKWFHEEWNTIFMTERNFLIEGARGLSKCRVAGQRILKADGCPTPVEALVGAPVNIATLDPSTSELKSTRALIKPDGLKRTKVVTLWSGRKHHLTCNEPLLTQRGWVKADQIVLGDHVAHVRRAPEPIEPEQLDQDEAYIAGLLIGAGGCTGTGVRLSCADAALIERIRPTLKKLGIKIKKIQGDNVDWSLSGNALKLTRKYGLQGKTSHTKRIPSIVFKAQRSAVAAFLAGYWDADGCFPRSNPMLTFGSCNKPLLEDTQTLLHRIECVGLLRFSPARYKGELHDAYVLQLFGPEAEKLLSECPTRSEKANLAKASWAQRYADGQEKFARTTGLPNELLAEVAALFGSRWLRKNGVGQIRRESTIILKSKVERAIKAVREFARLPRTERLKSRCKARGSTPEELEAVAAHLKSLLAAPVWWDRVVATSDGGWQNVYALSAEEHQIFIGEDCISHNTTWITACVLWLIGRQPNLRITWLSSTDKQASKRLRAVRRHIEENKLYQAVFPKVRISKAKEDANTTEALTIERDAVLIDPTIEAKGVLSSGVGSRIDVLILDDIVDQRNALLYPNMRPMVLNKLQSDWMQTVDQKYGRVFAIYNTWHREDAHKWLEANTGWLHKKYCHGKPNDPYYSIFPELFSRVRLIELRRSEGPIHYARGRLCKALTDETAAVLPSQFLPYNARLLTRQALEAATAIIAVDPASGKKLDKGKLDYSGFAVLLYAPITGEAKRIIGYRIFVVESFQVNLRRRQLIVLIKQLIRQWRPEKVLVEAEGLSDFHTDLIEDQSVDPSIILPITSRSRSKGQRLLGVSPLFYPPEGHDPIVYFHPKVIEDPPSKDRIVLSDGVVVGIERTAKMQIVNFPTDHDDAMDSLVYGLDYIRSHVAPDGLDFVPKLSFEPISISKGSKERREASEAAEALSLPPNPADWPVMPAINELLAQFKEE